MDFFQSLSPLRLHLSLVKNHWLFRIYFFINVVTPLITYFFLECLFRIPIFKKLIYTTISFIFSCISYLYSHFSSYVSSHRLEHLFPFSTSLISILFNLQGNLLEHNEIVTHCAFLIKIFLSTLALYISLKLTILFPFSPKIFYLRTFVELISTRYLICSLLRVLDKVGLGFLYHTQIDKIDLKTRFLEKEWLRLVVRYSQNCTPIATDISAQVMYRYLRTALQGYELFAFPLMASPLIYPINQMNGIQNDPIETIQNAQPITSKRELKWFQKRIAQLNRFISDIIEDSKYRMNYANIVPPTFALKRVMAQLDELLRYELDEHPLFKLVKKSFKSKTLRTEFKSRKKISNYLDRFKQKLHSKVYIPYQRLYDFIQQELLPYSNSSKNVGLCSLKNGEALYNYSLDLYTTDSEWTSQYIYEVGMREIEDVKEKMYNILEFLGWERNIAKAAEKINNDPSNFFEDSEEGKKEILAQYQYILDDIQPNITHLFSTIPKVQCKIVSVPSFKEKSAPPAYYTPAPYGDRTKSGIFSVNLSSVKNHPKHGMKALAYHESIPGHHFQLSIAQEEPSLPSFRRNIPFMAYTEGYALYVEKLAYEQGWYSTPLEQFGYLQNEMWRACRLVVDVGIHKKGWSREEAISFMENQTGLSNSVVTAEVERYIVFPGQAVSYKVGQLTILQLRDMAIEDLKEKFDIREFHDTILHCGSVPLDVLKVIVKNWIKDKKCK